MKEKQLFEAIRNHQVEAPSSIMDNAITASKRRRFFAFRWYSLNVWYLGIVLASSISYFTWNSAEVVPAQSNQLDSMYSNGVNQQTSEKSLSAGTVKPTEQKEEQVVSKQTNHETTGQSASLKATPVKPEVQMDVTVNPNAEENNAQMEKVELSQNSTDVSANVEVDAGLKEEKQQVVKSEVSVPDAPATKAKTKKLPVKLVQPK